MEKNVQPDMEAIAKAEKQGLLFVDDNKTLKKCSKWNITKISIPEGVTKIGKSAFENCTSLTSIVIPKSVTRIESFAFRGCSSLTNVVKPKRVKYAVDAFNGCPCEAKFKKSLF